MHVTYIPCNNGKCSYKTLQLMKLRLPLPIYSFIPIAVFLYVRNRNLRARSHTILPY